MKVWVLTREENQYDQYGEYFDAVFSKKPNKKQLMTHVDDTKIVTRLLEKGGGRENDEQTWYFLREVDC